MKNIKSFTQMNEAETPMSERKKTKTYLREELDAMSREQITKNLIPFAIEHGAQYMRELDLYMKNRFHTEMIAEWQKMIDTSKVPEIKVIEPFSAFYHGIDEDLGDILEFKFIRGLDWKFVPDACRIRKASKQHYH